MFDEISKSIKATLYERVSSPLTGSFIISWIVINWKVVLSIFSSLPVKSKIEFIEALYPAWWNYALYGLALPLIVSTIFILLYPYPTKWLYKYWYKRKVALKNDKLKIESKRLLTYAESQKITEELVLLENSKNEELNSKDEQIAKLKNIISIQNKDNPTEVTSSQPIEIKLSNDAIQALTQAAVETDLSNSDSFNFSDLPFYSKHGRNKSLLILEELVNNNYLDFINHKYYMNNNGRTFLVEKGVL